jgi:hypothetical protein
MTLSSHDISSPGHRLSLEQLLHTTSQRRGSNFRASYYPKACLTPELERKVAVLGAFKLVVASGDFRRKEARQEQERTRTPHYRPKTRQDDFSLFALSKALETQKKCLNCRQRLCRCVRTIYDETLDKVLSALGKRARTASPTSYGEGRPSKSSRIKLSRPQTAGKLILRSTLGTHGLRRRNGLFRSRLKGGDTLDGLLRVASVTPLKRSKSSHTKFQFPAESLMKDMSQNT